MARGDRERGHGKTFGPLSKRAGLLRVHRDGSERVPGRAGSRTLSGRVEEKSSEAPSGKRRR